MNVADMLSPRELLRVAAVSQDPDLLERAREIIDAGYPAASSFGKTLTGRRQLRLLNAYRLAAHALLDEGLEPGPDILIAQYPECHWKIYYQGVTWARRIAPGSMNMKAALSGWAREVARVVSAREERDD